MLSAASFVGTVFILSGFGRRYATCSPASLDERVVIDRQVDAAVCQSEIQSKKKGHGQCRTGQSRITKWNVCVCVCVCVIVYVSFSLFARVQSPMDLSDNASTSERGREHVRNESRRERKSPNTSTLLRTGLL